MHVTPSWPACFSFYMSEQFSENELNQQIHGMFLAGVDFDDRSSSTYQELVSRVRALKDYPIELSLVDEVDLSADVEELSLLTREVDPDSAEQATAYARALRLGRDLVRRTYVSAHEFHEHREEVLYDPMTHALNQRGIEHALREQFDIDLIGEAAPTRLLRGPERRGHQPVLVFGDLTNFRKVDKLLGQQVGDEALRELVREMQELMRRGDPIVRFGGDEFGALLKLTKKGCATMHARILRAQEEKLTSGRNQAAWNIIEREMEDYQFDLATDPTAAETRQPDWCVRTFAEGDRESRWLCNGTHPLVPLRDLVVFSFGMQAFRYGDRESYRQAMVLIQMRMKGQKRRFHDLMGGAYRSLE